MGATNHTSNYNLPQWIGTDKPTFLGDMNDAFLKIDTQMKANADSASSAESAAGSAESAATAASQSASQALQAAQTASTNASQAVNTANSASETANNANTAASAASTAATQAQGTASTAINRINNLKFPAPTTVTSFIPANANGQLSMSYNAELNLYNIYGFISTTSGYLPNNSAIVMLSQFPDGLNQNKEIFACTTITEGGRGRVIINTDGSLRVTTDTNQRVQFVGINAILNCAGWFD